MTHFEKLRSGQPQNGDPSQLQPTNATEKASYAVKLFLVEVCQLIAIS